MIVFEIPITIIQLCGKFEPNSMPNTSLSPSLSSGTFGSGEVIMLVVWPPVPLILKFNNTYMSYDVHGQLLCSL